MPATELRGSSGGSGSHAALAFPEFTVATGAVSYFLTILTVVAMWLQKNLSPFF